MSQGPTWSTRPVSTTRRSRDHRLVRWLCTPLPLSSLNLPSHALPGCNECAPRSPDSFGLGFWLTERCSRKYPDEIFGLVAAQLLTVAVLAVAWCVQAGDLPLSLTSLKETVLPSSGNLAVPISLMWTGLVTTSLTVFGETLAMKKVSAAESTIILSTEPIWGTAFAACLLGERIGWNTGLGALLIVSACTWSSVGPALQTKMLSLLAAAAGASSVVEGGMVDVDDLAETVGTVIKEIVRD